MKIQLKLISLLVIVAVACGGIYFSAFVRAQSAPSSQASPEPDANKKEGTYSASPTPSPSPRR